MLLPGDDLAVRVQAGFEEMKAAGPVKIVLHVIGGAKTLPAIAKALNIDSKRLILAGDSFDAAAITTKCYDAPPKGLSKLPIAHLQSVRFQRIGVFPRGFGRRGWIVRCRDGGRGRENDLPDHSESD